MLGAAVHGVEVAFGICPVEGGAVGDISLMIMASELDRDVLALIVAGSGPSLQTRRSSCRRSSFTSSRPDTMPATEKN